MSALLMGRAFYTVLPSHLKLTLLALCDEAADDGSSVFIGQRRLAEKVGATSRTVRTNLAELRDRGYIVRLAERHPSWNTDQYEIVVASLPTDRIIGAVQRSPERPTEITSAPEVHDRPDRKSSAHSTGSGLPLTHELPVSSTHKNDNAQTAVDLEAEFEAFWIMCPRRVGKGQARKAFKAARRKVDLATIGNAIEAYAESVQGSEPRFIAHPATWLNGERWTDEAPADRLGEMLAAKYGPDA